MLPSCCTGLSSFVAKGFVFLCVTEMALHVVASQRLCSRKGVACTSVKEVGGICAHHTSVQIDKQIDLGNQHSPCWLVSRT